MIDLHCHILPGLDDGPASFEGSLALAQAALTCGTQMIVATPHIRSDFRFDTARIAPAVDDLNEKLRERDLPLTVLPGAEIAIAKATGLSDDVLRTLCLASGDYVLVESPYRDDGKPFADDVLRVQARGFKPVLAHPERSPYFHRRPELIAELVEHGVACSVTSSALAGRFGAPVRRFVIRMLAAGLVHNVASDAHSATRRGPDVTRGFVAARDVLPHLADNVHWFTVTAPAAILAGAPLPSPPALGVVNEDALAADSDRDAPRSVGARLRARFSRASGTADSSR